MADKPDLNSATQEQLSSINGIGESLASRIVTYRSEHGKFNSFDDLKNISGFGASVIHTLQEKTSISINNKQTGGNGKLDINSATMDDLTSIEGISRNLAGRIIEYRQKNGRLDSIDSLKNISGIGDYIIHALKEKAHV